MEKLNSLVLKNLSEVTKLIPKKIGCETYSVYDLNGYSVQELLCQLQLKINQIIELSNGTLELTEWLVNEGLTIEVALNLEKWLNDGTLENLINKEIFKDLNNLIDGNIEEVLKLKEKIDNNLNVTVEMFGAVGDGVTDDSESLQKAFDWSIETGKTIFLQDKLYYTTKTLNIGDATIRSISQNPGYADVRLLRYKGKGAPNWTYFYNTGEGLKTSWRDMINKTAYGCCIISDKNIIICYVPNEKRINMEGICIIGNHREKNQYGIKDETPSHYFGTAHHIKKVNVLGCGNTGIHLQRGFEVSTIDYLDCSYNMGYGLYTGKNSFDSATEYLQFNNCCFTFNRLDGVRFEYWRKDINFFNTMFNGNGQYEAGEIDTLLGYNRVIPQKAKDKYAGVCFKNGSLDESNNISNGLSFNKCYGEEIGVFVKIINNIGNGVINNVEFIDNTIYIYPPSVHQNTECCAMYIDVNYISHWDIKRNNNHGVKPIVLEKKPNIGLSVNIQSIEGIINELEQSVTYSNIKSNGKLEFDNILDENLGGFDSDRVLKSNCIKSDYTYTPGVGISTKVGLYLVSGNFQGTQMKTFGTQLIAITRVASDGAFMCNIVNGNNDVFLGDVTIESDGTLNIPSKAFHMYSVIKLDNGIR